MSMVAARHEVSREGRARRMQRAAFVMGLVADVRKNAPFIGIMLAIAITWLALILALVALLLRM